LIHAASPYTLSYTLSLQAFCGPRDNVPITRPAASIAGPPESPSHVPFALFAPPTHSCVELIEGSLQSCTQRTVIPPTL
jgi:hypothetical protein